MKQFKSSTHYIYGTNAVHEALTRRPDAVRALFIEGDKRPELRALAKVGVTSLDARNLPGDLPRDVLHQGVLAAIDTSALFVPYRNFIDGLMPAPDTALVILGELQDPHNVGAIIRSAAAFGIAGVLIPPHRQVSVTGTVIKVSAGMAFQVPLIEIANVNAVIRDLKDRGFWVYGLDGQGNVTLGSETFDRPSAFVIGNEGTGLREKTREACDSVLAIPMESNAESLNASNAAAVTFFEWRRQHPIE